MCSLFIALIPPHSSLLLFSSLLLSLSFGLRCTDSNRLQWRSVCLWETEAQTKRRYRNMASRHFSRRVIQYEWNTSSSACVCLRSVFVRRDDGGETKTSWEICVHQTDRETKRWRDKIEQPRQKRERRRETQSETIYLVCVLGWLVCST